MRLPSLLVVASVFTLALSQSSASSPVDCISCPPVPDCPPCAAGEACFLTARSCTTCGSAQCGPSDFSGSASQLGSITASQSGSGTASRSQSISAVPSAPSGTSAALGTNLGASLYLVSGLAAIGVFFRS
ncbi:hypothetical protein B0H16DRAFT_1562339 [Mycena metata]|uniref:Membrane anchor Opy2 N-terminal domain-containing protein n=1 Tax=Mycena metata TaxID=1033252 RepID=A0AAD7II43_9AGAR|nr:hypothetical protein B0H16DRAFT_1562339 [Mycena metata]